ncbi:MAG: hypothetical protein IJR66_00135 [Clostridia bacterium]|nr:hypothetical protein [Clostridia bacterium]MBQ9513379.1 hypothetical protein [Clostridia bacterium]
MKTSDIGNIIDNFIESPATAIMFNGNWGIGKTFAIDTLLNKDRDKKKIYDFCNIHYISLFGFKNIEILHQELYKMFHPWKVRTAKALSYISLAISLEKVSIGLNNSQIREDLEKNQINKSLAKNDFQNIIIFDDIERIAVKKEGFIELLGYFNRLINEGIKVIAICNSDELPSDNKEVYDNFKEKIFDRIYMINEDNIDVIKKIFGDKFKLLDEETIYFFKNNLRLVKKSKIFLDEVLKQLSKMKSNPNINDRTICLICILIIKEVFTSCFSEELYKEQQKKLNSKETEDHFYTNLILEKYGTDDLCIEAIDRELQKKKVYGVNAIIRGLFNYFKYYDCSFFNQKVSQKKLFTKSLFYYSDKEKKTAITELLTIIYERISDFDARQIYDAVRDILNYDNGNINEVDLYKLSEIFIKIEDENKKNDLIDNFYQDLYFEHSPTEEKFVEILKEKIKEQEIDAIISYFDKIDIKKYDGSLTNWIVKLQSKGQPLAASVCIMLKKNNYFLPALSNTISENEWRFCHDMCSFINNVDKSLVPDLIAVLDNQIKEHSDSICIKERVDALKKYKLVSG